MVSSPEDSSGRERFLDLGSHTDIGQQHKLLNQTISLSLLFLLHIDRFRTFRRIEVNLQFSRRERQSSSSNSTFLQLDCDGIEQSDRGRQWIIAGPAISFRVRWWSNDSLVVLAELGGFVSECLFRGDYRFCESDIHNLCLGREFLLISKYSRESRR